KRAASDGPVGVPSSGAWHPSHSLFGHWSPARYLLLLSMAVSSVETRRRLEEACHLVRQRLRAQHLHVGAEAQHPGRQFGGPPNPHGEERLAVAAGMELLGRVDATRGEVGRRLGI